MFNIFKNKDFLCFVSDSKNTQGKPDLTIKRECGRSMIEMIGVLVLIGLFTIGGVIGYKTAFDTYRATSIMDTVLKGKLAVEADYRVAGKSTLVRAINNGPIADVNNKVEYYTDVACGNRQCKEYVIKTKESAAVCEKIVLRQSLYNSSDESDNTPEIYITPNNVDACGEEGEVDMTFTFQIPMLKTDGGRDVYEPIDGTLKESTCPVGHIVIDGVCQCRPACDRGDGICKCCNTGYDWDADSNSCICPAGTHDTGSECITCPVGTRWNGSKCENPCTDGKIWNGTICMDPCTGGKEWNSSSNACVCPEGTHDNGESCITCSAPTTYWDNELNKCTCPTGYVERNGTCERKPTCTEPRTVYDEVNNTCQCPSEKPEYDEAKNVCNCPTTTPFWDSTKNQCVTCVVANVNTPIWNGTNCVSCAGADNTKPYWNGTECISCYANNPTTPYWNGTNCTTCPNATPVWNGTACVSCAEADSTKPVWNGTECTPCSSESPYWNGTSCISCYDDNQTTPYWNGTNCTVCPDAKLWNTESNQCVQCLDNENCSGSTPVCNDNNVCESCPDVMPVWHTDMKQCVQCLENEDCNDNATPVCNNSNMCESCPDAMPVWHTDMKQCVQCLENADCPSGTPVCNDTNACEPCPDETPIWVAETGKCIAGDGPGGTEEENCEIDCGWTGWLDSGKSDNTVNGGDVESLTNVCKNGYVDGIMCRAAMFPSTTLAELAAEGQHVVCNTEVGLVCRNADTFHTNAIPPACLNYQINVKCCSKSPGCYKCTTNADCSDDVPICNNGKCEACPSDTPYWDADENKCVAEMVCPISGCHTNNDCSEGEYCDITCYDNQCTNDTTTMSGRCRVANSDIQMPKSGTISPFVVSNRDMNWWSAKNFCQALETTLATIDDFGCAHDVINISIGFGHCYDSMHLDAIKNAYDWSVDGFWIDALYNSCNAFVMYQADEVSYNGKWQRNHAICKNMDMACEEGEIWNPELNKCTECTVNRHCSNDKPICNSETGTCEDCASETQYWTGSACEDCPSEKPYGNGTTCGICPNETPVWNGTTCEACPSDAVYWNGTACTPCTGETPVWNGTTCETCPSEKPYWSESEKKCMSTLCKGELYECKDNTDCGAGEYCDVTCFTENCTKDNIGFGGTCRKASSDIKKSNLYISSNRIMNWWSAKNFCQVLGKRMITVADLECAHTICPQGCDGTWGYCHANTDTNLTSSSNISTRISELKSQSSLSGTSFVWTNTDGSTGCYAYSIALGSLGYGSVLESTRLRQNYALCVTDCAAVDITKPHWNGTECEACPAETPYWNEETDQCEACPTGTLWNEASGNCVAALCKGVVYECNDNADCDAGEYCNITCYNDTCTKDTSGMGGTCQNANERIQPPENGTKPPFIMSNQPMTWWNANNFCEALGTTLVEVSDYACAHSICPSGCDATYGYCHADPSQSVTLSFATNDRTAKLQAMYEAYGSNISYGWTNTDTDDLCYAYNVSFYQGGMFNGLRYSSVVNAVCKPDCAATDVTKPYWNGTECEACPTGTLWNEATGECVAAICNGTVYECDENSDCEEGEYCDITCFAEYCISKTTNIGGSCRKASTDVSTPATGTNPPFVKANRGMYWWSGKNFCDALGMSLTEVSDYNCNTTICASGCDSTTAFCQTETNAMSENIAKIQAAYGLFWFWTATEYDSCNVYNVSTVYGFINYLRDSNLGGVVCKCDGETPAWNGTACVSCAEADSTKPVWNGTTCEACPTGTLWNEASGNCVAALCKGVVYECNDNADCDAGEYCNITCYLDSCTDDPTVMGGSCRKSMDDLKEKPASTSFLLSNKTMRWWSAKNFCQSLGTRILEVSDYNCAHTFVEGTGTGYCHKDTSTPIDKPGNISSIMENMKTAYGNLDGWTGTGYDSTCKAYFTSFENGNIFYTIGNENYHYTSCTCPSETPVWNGTSCEVCPPETPYWDGSVCVAECPNGKPIIGANNVCEACPTATPAWNGTACETCPAETPVWNGMTCESCPSGTSWSGTECMDTTALSCQTAMISAGFNTSNFTMDGTTVKYTGDMTLSKDLDISACNLDVAGTLTVNATLEVNNINAESSGDKGIDNYGRIIATGNITGTGTSDGVYNNGGQIEAQNITGTGTNYDGIYNAGAMDAQNITGTGGMYGIENYGGTITATRDISGSATGNNFGIYNWIGTMSATNVYYCQKINSTAGQIIGNVACGCSDSSSCTSVVMQCTAPTPILIGLESCISCADADSTKPVWNGTTCESCPSETPYWNGTTCVAECPSEMPTVGANNVCEACPNETPYWNGSSCVASCSGSYPYLNGTNCVASCSGTNKYLNGTTCSSSCPTYYDGTTCVSSCSSGKRDGTTCVTSCPTARPYLSAGVCVASCSGSYPYLNGTNCVASCSGTNKYLNGTTCSSSCPTYYDGTTCVSSCSSGKRDGTTCVTSCPTAKPYLSAGVCVASCSGSYPYLNGTNCVASCSGTNKYLNGTTCSSSCPTYYDGTTCVSSCSSGKRDGTTCVTSCPTARPYLSAGVCVASCSGSYPYLNGTNCVASCSGTNKYLNGTTCVSSCSGTNKYLNGTTCVASCSGTNKYLNGTTCSSSCPTYYDGTTCVSSCSSGKRDGTTCVTSCPTARPYLSAGVCVASCSGSYPYLNGTNCVASCSGTNKYLDGTTCKSSCSGTNKYYNGTTCSSSCPKYYSGTTCVTSCPTDRPYLDGTQCKTASEMATICTNAMKNGGWTSGYTVSGDTITYTGKMNTTVTTADLSKCNLTVKGQLYLNENHTVKVKNLNVTGSEMYAISVNWGTLTVSGNITLNTTADYGLYNYEGTVNVSGNINVTATGFGGIFVQSYSSATQIATLTANNITAKCTGDNAEYDACIAIDYGVVKVTNDVVGNGGSTGITVLGDVASLTAKNITGASSTSGRAGISASNGAQITATSTITGINNNDSNNLWGGVYCGMPSTTKITAPTIYYYPKKNVSSCTVSGTLKCQTGKTCTN